MTHTHSPPPPSKPLLTHGNDPTQAKRLQNNPARRLHQPAAVYLTRLHGRCHHIRSTGQGEQAIHTYIHQSINPSAKSMRAAIDWIATIRSLGEPHPPQQQQQSQLPGQSDLSIQLYLSIYLSQLTLLVAACASRPVPSLSLSPCRLSGQTPRP